MAFPYYQSDSISDTDDLASLSVRELKVRLDAAGVPYDDISEKHELVARARGAATAEDDEAMARRLQVRGGLRRS